MVIIRALGLSLLISGRLPGLPAQEPAPADELAQHLANMRQQAEDMSLPIGQRESLVLGMAGTLDRAAQSAPDDDQRQGHWSRAIELLDSFNTRNPGHPRTREFQLQAAVYRWAQGQSWRDLGDLNPADAKARQQAAAALDDAITRLRAIASGEAGDVLADNLRFRLARALADRADLEPSDSASRRVREAEALELLKGPMMEPGLKGFAGLLKADLLRRADRPDEATAEVDAASKSDPAPPEREVLDVRIPLLTARQKFAEAVAVLKASHLEEPAKELGIVHVRLAELAALPAGADRFPVERELFDQIQTLRGRKAPESRVALSDLARSGIDPDPRHEPEMWDILAEGFEVRGDAEKAGALEQRAAQCAEALGRPAAAAGFRLRGGGFLFQAGKYAEADALLTRVAADPRAGPLRAKASMLRGLARGRALAAGLPGITPAAYAQALQEQIRDFPREPATAEARWLLGSLLRASGERAKAEALWAAIAPESPRWLESRLAVADLRRTALESQLLFVDRHLLMPDYQRAQGELAANLKLARSETDEVELSLAEARLDLLPIVGQPQRALTRAERLLRMNLTAPQRYRTRLYALIAQAQLGRYVAAEREAQVHTSWAERSAREAFLDAVRLLDLSAAASEMDLPQRRYGMVLRLLVQPSVQDDDEKWTADQRAELKLRLIRAFLFLGDDRGARGALRDWTGPPRSAGDDLLRDLADAYNRLEAYELALDVQRLRARNLPAGSPSWFDARYGLALANFHAGRQKEAAQLIDATAILHPELGGGSIQKKFIKLRQRLGPRP
jgi:hypothetical protein